MNSNSNIFKKYSDSLEYIPLWKVTIWNKKFQNVSEEKQKQILKINKGVSASKLKELNVQNGNIKLLSTGNFDGWTTEELSSEYLNDLEVITLPEGGIANIKYYNGKFVNSLNLIATTIDNNKYSLKYIYYCLISKNELIESFYRGSGVRHPSMSDILDIEIPVPPIEVQREIVKILDNFTELTTELTLRKKQYEYYRDKLLSFNSDELNDSDIENLNNIVEGGVNSLYKYDYVVDRIGNYIVIEKGRQLNKEVLLKNGLYPVINGGKNPSGYWNEFNFENNLVTISQGGASAGYVQWQNDKFWAGAHCYVIKKKNDLLNYKYIYYLLKSNEEKIMNSQHGAGIPALNKNIINDISIKIPPLNIQNKIVEILDNFSSLVDDISNGIPKEIELRIKQYEYYRDKLLSFNLEN